MLRLREQQQNQFLRQPAMMPGQMAQLNMRRNGAIPPSLQKTVLQSNTAGLYVVPPLPFFFSRQPFIPSSI